MASSFYSADGREASSQFDMSDERPSSLVAELTHENNTNSILNDGNSSPYTLSGDKQSVGTAASIDETHDQDDTVETNSIKLSITSV